MHHIDMMARIAQSMRQAMDIHRIAAEAVRWIKGRNMEEIKRLHGAFLGC
jgi:hypothetical protein